MNMVQKITTLKPTQLVAVMLCTQYKALKCSIGDIDTISVQITSAHANI